MLPRIEPTAARPARSRQGGHHTVSRLVHWEIPSTDVQRSGAFYTALFGWSMQGWSDDYVLFDSGEGTGGGISKVETMPAPAIGVYIGVDDIDAALAKVEALGGRTVQARSEIGGDMGFTAAFEDPCGCRIGLWSKS
jgi:uncharacterized protein